MGCVGHHIIVIVFGIFVTMFEKFEHVITAMVVIALHKGCITHTFRASAPNSKGSLAGSALLYMFPRPWPRTWMVGAAKSTLTQRNVMCRTAALSASAVSGSSTVELMALRPAPSPQSREDVPHTSLTPRKGTHSPLPFPLPLLTKPTPRHQPPA